MKHEGRFVRGFWERRVLVILRELLEVTLSFPMDVKKEADTPDSLGIHLSSCLRMKLTAEQTNRVIIFSYQINSPPHLSALTQQKFIS